MCADRVEKRKIFDFVGTKDEKDRCKYLRQVRSKERILSTGSNQEESGDPRKWIGGQNQSPE